MEFYRRKRNRLDKIIENQEVIIILLMNLHKQEVTDDQILSVAKHLNQNADKLKEAIDKIKKSVS